MADDDLQQIADQWVEDFSVDPHAVRERQMWAWHQLDGLIYNDVAEALAVFEMVAAKDLISWTFEGFAAGPLRTFLMLHGDRYDSELVALGRRSPTFVQMWELAAEGS